MKKFWKKNLDQKIWTKNLDKKSQHVLKNLDKKSETKNLDKKSGPKNLNKKSGQKISTCCKKSGQKIWNKNSEQKISKSLINLGTTKKIWALPITQHHNPVTNHPTAFKPPSNTIHQRTVKTVRSNLKTHSNDANPRADKCRHAPPTKTHCVRIIMVHSNLQRNVRRVSLRRHALPDSKVWARVLTTLLIVPTHKHLWGLILSLTHKNLNKKSGPENLNKKSGQKISTCCKKSGQKIWNKKSGQKIWTKKSEQKIWTKNLDQKIWTKNLNKKSEHVVKNLDKKSETKNLNKKSGRV